MQTKKMICFYSTSSVKYVIFHRRGVEVGLEIIYFIDLLAKFQI